MLGALAAGFSARRPARLPGSVHFTFPEVDALPAALPEVVARARGAGAA